MSPMLWEDVLPRRVAAVTQVLLTPAILAPLTDRETSLHGIRAAPSCLAGILLGDRSMPGAAAAAVGSAVLLAVAALLVGLNGLMPVALLLATQVIAELLLLAPVAALRGLPPWPGSEALALTLLPPAAAADADAAAADAVGLPPIEGLAAENPVPENMDARDLTLPFVGVVPLPLPANATAADAADAGKVLLAAPVVLRVLMGGGAPKSPVD